MKIQPFKAIFPNIDMLNSTEGFFNTVKFEFPDYMKNGFFFKKTKKAFYVYSIETQNGGYTGFVTGIDVNEFVNNNVKEHEKTLAHKEQKMSHLLLRNHAMVKPVLLGYPSSIKIDEFLHDTIKNLKPSFTVRFEEEQEVHHFWEISTLRNIRVIKKLFDQHLTSLYIADGHHRISSAVNMYQNGQLAAKKIDRTIFSALFSFDQLRILDFNRVIDILGEIDPVLFVVKLSKYCKIKALKRAENPSAKHQFHMFLNDQWFELTWKKKILEKHKELKNIVDVNMFNIYVLQKILKIKDLRTDQRIEYVEGTMGQEGVADCVNKNNNCIGFTFFPLGAWEIIMAADNNESLPPKSSYFLPRIKNGLIVKEL